MIQSNLDDHGSSDDPDIADRLSQLASVLETASSRTQLASIRRKIDKEIKKTDRSLKQTCSSKRASHEAKTRTLEMSRMGLSTAVERSKALGAMLAKASKSSAQITEKVRVLDCESARIKKLKKYVDDVRQLKQQLQQADESISHEKWKEAAESVYKIRQLPKGIINDGFVQSVVPSSQLPELPGELLARWTDELLAKITQSFESAAQKQDMGQITYFFQLFPLIGHQEAGIQCYSKFVCQTINDQFRALLRKAQGRSDVHRDFYPRILFQLYQTIAQMVNQHFRIIRKYYGSQVLPEILTQIQEECDLQSAMILDTFMDTNNVEEVVSHVRKYGYPALADAIYGGMNDGSKSPTSRLSHDGGSGNTSRNSTDQTAPAIDADAPSLADIGTYTDALSAMMNHWSMYAKFFSINWNESRQKSSNDMANSIYPAPLVLSPFGKKISSNVANTFDVLSTYAVRRTLEKASMIEQTPSIIPQLGECVRYLSSIQRRTSSNQQYKSLRSLSPENVPVSSIVDDLAMLLNVILSEALSTGQLVSIKAMSSNVKRVIEDDFIGIMKRKFDQCILQSGATLLTPENLHKVQKLLDKGNNATERTTAAAKKVSSTTRGSLLAKSISMAINIASEEVGKNAETNGKTLMVYIIVLNSISAFNSYVESLSDHLTKYLERQSLLIVDDQELIRVRKDMEASGTTVSPLQINLKTSRGTEDKPSVEDRIRRIIASLHTSFAEKSGSLLKLKVGQLFTKVMKSKLSTMITDAFPSNAYLVSSEMISSEIDGVSTKITNFLSQWNQLIIPYLTTMSKQNFSLLVENAVSLVATQLESQIWAMDHRCNEIGTANLERDASVLISEITRYDYSLRDKFIRVTQMIMLMGLDDDEDIEDLEDLDWALIPSERTRARGLRIDRKGA